MQMQQAVAAGCGFWMPDAGARMEAAAKVLESEGYTRLPVQRAEDAALVLLGVPVHTLQPWEPVLKTLAPQTLLFAGALSAPAQQQAAQLSLCAVDYMQSEELALFNAVPTAEGALAILLSATDGLLWRSRVVLTGYGRIAKVLAPRLRALGAQVTVAARSPLAQLQAQTLGYEAAPLAVLPQLAAQADFLVTTVPHPVVDASVLAALPQHAFVLDLAGAPGGVDLAAAQRMGIRAQNAPGLPGKYAAAAAGEAIGRTVCAYLHRHDPTA